MNINGHYHNSEVIRIADQARDLYIALSQLHRIIGAYIVLREAALVQFSLCEHKR